MRQTMAEASILKKALNKRISQDVVKKAEEEEDTVHIVKKKMSNLQELMAKKELDIPLKEESKYVDVGDKSK